MLNISDIYTSIFNMIRDHGKGLLLKIVAYIAKKIKLNQLNRQLQIEW